MSLKSVLLKTLKEDKQLSSFCILVFGMMLGLQSCKEKPAGEGKLYTGPIEVINNVEIKYSEQGNPKVVVKTPKSFGYQNETKIFPDTININFYDSLGTIQTTLRSDSGRYDHNADVYIVKGNVRVVKSLTNETLTTSELFWSPRTRKVFTEKPLAVRNNRTSEVTNAIGMDAEQDFTRIKFRKATGVYKFSGAPQ